VDKIKIIGTQMFGTFDLRGRLNTEVDRMYIPLIRQHVTEGFRLANDRQSELLSAAGLSLIPNGRMTVPPDAWFSGRAVRWFAAYEKPLPAVVIAEALPAAEESFDQAEYYYKISADRKIAIDNFVTCLGVHYGTKSYNFMLSDVREMQRIYDTSNFNACNPYYLRKNTLRNKVTSSPSWEQFMNILGELSL
jgi:hypothetical protein